MTSIGPFSVQVVAVALAALLGWLVAAGLQRRRGAHGREAVTGKTATALLTDALLIGLFVARLAYVARWWAQYAAAPRSIVAIGDGGFYPLAGLAAALPFLFWRLRRHERTAWRVPVLGGVAAALLAWGAAHAALALLTRQAPPLAALYFTTLDGTPYPNLHRAGQPVVVNLWASWCPPCRREMPVLARAQAAHPGLTVLLVDQGEDAATVRAFLDAQGLHPANVLLDPASATMRAYGSRGLPTTLFFDARGRLVESHLGEITAARLEDVLGGRFGR